MAYDPSTDAGQVRLLINDVDDADQVFTDDEIDAFLAMNGGAVKLAAAQAIETNAGNEALASKVLRTLDLQTDGAKLAEALLKVADRLRRQHFDELEDGGFFAVVEFGAVCGPELT